MRLIVNGNAVDLEDNSTIVQALEKLGYVKNNVAVAVNQEFVSRDDWDKRKLATDEKVEIVLPMQGG